MSTLNNVFKKLEHTDKVSQVNLESQKVELGSIKELNAILSDSKNIISAIEKQGEVLAKKLSDAIIERRKFSDAVLSLKSLSYNTAKAQVDDFKKKASELGVDVNNVQELKEIDKLISKTKEYEQFDKSIPTIPQI
jgi:hypothetical protein